MESPLAPSAVFPAPLAEVARSCGAEAARRGRRYGWLRQRRRAPRGRGGTSQAVGPPSPPMSMGCLSRRRGCGRARSCLRASEQCPSSGTRRPYRTPHSTRGHICRSSGHSPVSRVGQECERLTPRVELREVDVRSASTQLNGAHVRHRIGDTSGSWCNERRGAFCKPLAGVLLPLGGGLAGPRELTHVE